MNELSHVAIIPDGNRRWAKKNNVDLDEVYYSGCQKMLNFASFLFGQRQFLKEVSLFFVSYENLRFRKKGDLDPLFKSGIKFVEDFHEFAKTQNIELRWVGLTNYDFSIDSDYFQIFKNKVEELPKLKKSEKKLNILIGYDVENEINAIVEKYGYFKQSNMEIKSQVNLVVRTGGMNRFSGFLPLHTKYSELFVLRKNFPEMEESDLEKAIGHFSQTTKKMGN